jgi:predicted ATPase/transcriptional regulator with XRE-family HTH domain
MGVDYVSSNPRDNQAAAFGNLLRRLRLRAGLSQEALAERAGVGLSTIAALEHGDRPRPRPATVALLAQALDAGSQERAELLGAASATPSSPQTRTALPLVRLPVPPTPLIGRETEVAAACALLRPNGQQRFTEGRSRLLTLVGAGGVGKTRLALAVAAELADAYADGATFVDLAPVHDHRLVPATLARFLALRESGARSAREILLNHLRELRTLLVLDNFEHLLSAAPLLSELLEGCAHLALLVTSRTVLRVRSERRFPVGPLATPADQQPSMEAIADSPAVRLFVERAQAVAPAFSLEPSNAHEVAAICRRLDGMPLAIELAAARASWLAPKALLRRLERRLPLSQSGPPDLPERQQTVRKTLAWSHNLLDPADQSLFRRLAVFSGGWSLEAAESVCATAQFADDELLQRVGVLVDNSLVQPTGGADDEPRFAMLGTVREYAEEQLVDSGEADETRRRHATWYLQLAEMAAPELHGLHQTTWLQRLEDEHDNIRAALDWLTQRGECDQALRLATAATWHWLRRSYFTDARRLFGLLAACDTCRDQNRAAALLAAARVASAQGDYTAMAGYDEHALRLFRELDDRVGIAEAMTDLGAARWQQGRLDLARESLAVGLQRFRDLDNSVGIATALLPLACVARDQGDFAAAEPLFDEALARRQASGDQLGVAHVVNNRAWQALYAGDLTLAHRLVEQSLAIRRALGSRREAGVSQTLLGKITLAAGERATAHALLMEALAVHREVGNRWGVAMVLESLAELAAGTQPELTLRLAGAAEAIRTAIGRPQAPVEEAIYRRLLEPARRALPAPAAARAWSDGESASEEQVIADTSRVAVSAALPGGAFRPQETPRETITGSRDLDS